MIRAKFLIDIKECGEDYRPVKWTIKYPYWCTGESDDAFNLIAYADNLEEIKELWPEAHSIEIESADCIKFTSRLPCPSWFKTEAV